MTLLQTAVLYKEEDMLDSKDFIINNQYEEAFKDVQYSFLIKLFLRYLLSNDSDERPDFILAKTVFNQMFFTSSENSGDLSEVLEGTINLDNWNSEAIMEALKIQNSETNHKSIYDFSGATLVGYDSPKPTDIGNSRSKSFKNFINRDTNLDDYYPDTIMPLKLDEKFSDWVDESGEHQTKSKICEFLERATENNPRLLPISKVISQQNPFTNKAVMCKKHNKVATKACMLLHYGEYFCDSCNHKWGEVEDLIQTDKHRQKALKEIANNHKDLITKVEALNKRRTETEDIDLIFYHIFDSVKMIHQEVKAKQALKDNDLELMNDFIQKIEKSWSELKSLKYEIDYMYQK